MVAQAMAERFQQIVAEVTERARTEGDYAFEAAADLVDGVIYSDYSEDQPEFEHNDDYLPFIGAALDATIMDGEAHEFARESLTEYRFTSSWVQDGKRVFAEIDPARTYVVFLIEHLAKGRLQVVEEGGVSDDAAGRGRVHGAPLDADAGGVRQRVTRNERAEGDPLTFINFQDTNGDFYLINLCEERDGTYSATVLRAVDMDIEYDLLPVIAQVAAPTRDDALIQAAVLIGKHSARLEGGDAADVNG